MRPRGSPTARRPRVPVARRRDLDEDLRQHARGRDAVELGLGIQQQAVREHGLGERLHVVGHHVVPAVGGGPGAGRAHEREGAAHARAQPHLGRGAGRVDQAHHVVGDRGIHVHGPRALLQRPHGGGRRDGRERHVVRAHGRALQVPQHRLVVGVPDGRAQQEPVELRLGQRVGAGLLDRVLGRDDHERVADVVGRAVDRDTALLHHLEERGLGLRARAVDLVGQHDAREHRPAVELELARALVVDADARDVAGQHVGRELHPAVGAVDGLRHGARERGLAGAGHVLEQEVAARDHGREGEAHDVGLAEQHLLHVAHEPRELVLEGAGLVGGHRHGACLSGAAASPGGMAAGSAVIRGGRTCTGCPSSR